MTTKTCLGCGNLYIRNSNGQKFCNAKCRTSNSNRRLWSLKLALKRKGLTIEDFEIALQNQSYVCAICRQPETTKSKGTLRRLSIDHSHKTGCYRGLLCGKCNQGIGHFDDDIALLNQAIQYLERHKDPRDNT